MKGGICLLENFQDREFDLIVIGAGINGAGIARDAAMRGLNVLLLDKGDIAGGTTSWSTRLIHGGLRYLQYCEISLVRESLRERARLLHIAPHLVRALPFLIPIYKGARYGQAKIRAGMLAYSLLSLGYVLGEHRLLSSREALSVEPGLNPHGLIGAVLYFDAQVEYPERLTLETAISAREHGATVLTYCRVDRILLEASNVRGVEFTDVLTGRRHQARAAVTINVTGPWVDEVLRRTGQPVKQFVSPTKGSHLIVEPFPGAPRHALYVEASRDGRPFFIVPWTGLYLVGTTDLYYEGDLDQVTVLDEEIEYLLQETNHILPGANLTADKIAYCYSGLRPLPHVASGCPADITRRHFIHDHAPELCGLYSVVGGKITTYRNLGEKAVDVVFRKLGRQAPRSTTAANPLPGTYSEDLAREVQALGARYRLGESTALRLLRVYGRRAINVLDLCSEDLRWRRKLSAQVGAIGAEVVFAFRTEMARTLADVLLRRTMVGMRPDLGLGASRAAAEIAAQTLGWSRDRAEDEIMEYGRCIERFKLHRMEAVG